MLTTAVNMPRHSRVSPDGFVQHVVNRGDHRETLFHKPGDFAAFLFALADTACRIPMRILAYCIMRNHFHLLLWPHAGSDLPRFMQLLMNVHIARYLRHYPPASCGHLYQGRYTNAIVENGRSVLTVARYVEANALSAQIVARAEHYDWSSASPKATADDRPTLSDWPVPKPPNWSTLVNLRTPGDELQRIRLSAARGIPYGSVTWTNQVIKDFKLEHTVRPRGRPRTRAAVTSPDNEGLHP